MILRNDPCLPPSRPQGAAGWPLTFPFRCLHIGRVRSLKDCRRLLGTAGARLSDNQVEQLRDQLMELAVAVVSLYRRDDLALEECALQMTLPPDREAIEERAAILEFDAGVPRDLATRTALTGHLERAVLERGSAGRTLNTACGLSTGHPSRTSARRKRSGSIGSCKVADEK
jgi:hypothetical protein